MKETETKMIHDGGVTILYCSEPSIHMTEHETRILQFHKSMSTYLSLDPNKQDGDLFIDTSDWMMGSGTD